MKLIGARLGWATSIGGPRSARLKGLGEAHISECLLKIGEGASNHDRRLDVVFVHGLDGDCLISWSRNADDPKDSWLSWLADEDDSIGIWSYGYDAASSRGRGGNMDIRNRARNLLTSLEAHGIGEKPTIFVGHSLGGIVVKVAIATACEFDMSIGRNTRGVVFLATPHTGSGWASLADGRLWFVPRPSAVLRSLARANPEALGANEWYRNNAKAKMIETLVFSETNALHGIIVVDQVSADPGLPGVFACPVPEDHRSIARPTRNGLVYLRTRRFISDLAQGRAPTPLRLKANGELVETFDDVNLTASAERLAAEVAAGNLKNVTQLDVALTTFDVPADKDS